MKIFRNNRTYPDQKKHISIFPSLLTMVVKVCKRVRDVIRCITTFIKYNSIVVCCYGVIGIHITSFIIIFLIIAFVVCLIIIVVVIIIVILFVIVVVILFIDTGTGRSCIIFITYKSILIVYRDQLTT